MFVTDYRIWKNNLCSEIKQVFEKENKIDIYYNKYTCDIHKFQNSRPQVFTDKWLNDIQLKPKLRTFMYILFNNEYNTEEYVNICRPGEDRSLLA